LGKTDGALTVTVARISPHDPLRDRHPQLDSRHALRLSVRDNGPGIPPHLQERIFDPFFTTKPVGQGSGLGLSSVHGITRAHDGVILLESVPGDGATFHLCFPECPTQAEPPADAPEPARIGDTHRRRLLLVDDEETITDIATAALDHLGWDVTAHNDPRDALASFEASPDDFAALITGLSMPGMDGAELSRLVRSRRPGL